jgi:hypothetical protein
MTRTRLLWTLDIVIKIGLVLLLAHAMLFPDLPQYAGKGIGSRLVLYPLGVVIVPLVWWVSGRIRGRRGPYPLVADILISAPFTIDTLGNALNLFNTIDAWDDLMHFTQWLLLLGGIGVLLAPRVRPRWALGLLVASLGAYVAVAWEVAEYWAFIRTSPELQTAYTDTLGDMVLGSLGSTVAGLVVSWTLARGSEPHGSTNARDLPHKA